MAVAERRGRMSKSKLRGRRGERWIPGPPGPLGPSGAVGKHGLVGARGKTGASGTNGATGARGATGAIGEAGAARVPPKSHALAEVHDQIEHIYHELDVQMKRMAQLQAELDQVRATLRRLMGP
jgi:hypothetical protein